MLDALQNAKISATKTEVTKLLGQVATIVLYTDDLVIRLKDDHKRGGAIRIAADLRSAKSGLRVVEEHGANQRSESLIRSLAFAHHWRQHLERGQFKTLQALDDAKSLSESYAWKLLRLSYLAPDIVEAILDGHDPSNLNLHQIYAAKFTGDWVSQRRALGFPERF